MTTNISLEMSGDMKKYMVSAIQGDRATRNIHVKLMNDGEPYNIPDDARAIVNIKKPDGKFIYNACEHTENIVIIELTSQALAVCGTAYCDVEIRTNDNKQIITSESFEIEIEENQRSDTAIESSNEITEVEARINKWIEVLSETNNAAVLAEKSRNENEQKRTVAETNRINAENSRSTSEKEREKKEAERENAENKRADEEEKRSSAEKERKEQTNKAITAANSAAESANRITKEINEKLEKGEFKGEKGDQGEKGEKGEKGESGEIATAENAGIVKPDGETITIDPDGTIHGQSVGKNPLTKVYFNYGSYFPGSSFEESAQILAGYDLICCEGSISGWTDSEKRQNEMALVQEVRRRNPKVKFFRYISVKNKYDATSKTRVPINKYDLYQQIRATLHMGGTWTTDKDEDGYEIVTGGIPYDGIFWDDFDSLSGVTELNDGDEQSWESVLEKQNDVIEEARRFGLCSFGNAWHVIELVSGKPIDNEPYYNPKSLKSSIGENDYLMVESCEFYPKEPIDGFGYWSGEDSSYKVYNYMKNYYPTQKANLVCFSSGGYSMTVEEKQCALTWMLMDLLVMGGRYVCFDQGLIYDMPEALKAFYYDDLSDATITRVASGHYQMRVNGHTIITKRESGLANSKATSNSFKLAHIWIDGVEIKNLFAQAPSIAFAMSEQIEEVNTRLDTLAPDIKKNVSRYHRLMIDDWIPTREPGAYPNLVPSSNGSGNGISITSRSGYDMEGSVQNGWGSYRWTIDATAYRGKTLEIGCSKFTLSATNKASIGIVIYDAQTWSNRQTIYTTTNNESDVGNGSGLNIKYTVSEAQNTIMFGFWGFGAAADDFFSVDDFYVIDPTSMEELLSKSDYTNRSIGFDSWVDSVSWKRPDDLTTLPYTITADKNDITIEYKEDGYAAYKGICVVMQTAGTLTPGSTWEIGCESFISNAEDNIRVRAYVYALAGWSPYIIPSKVDQSALHDVKCPHVTVTVPETAKDAKGCYIEILNLSATPYNTLSDGTKEAHKAVIKGFYMCDVNEENVIIRGLTPANTWLQICRVKDSVLAKDAKMISNALYITDSGKMFITDFSGNKIDIVKE